MKITQNEKEEWQETIRGLIKHAQIEKALEKIFQDKNFLTNKELIQIEVIASRYYNWKNDNLKGIVNESNVEYNKIVNSILEVLSSKNSLDKKKKIGINTKKYL